MIIEKGSDLVLRIKDDKGNGIRVANKPSFFIKVFTSDKNTYLEYSKDEVVERNDFDTIAITADKLAELGSGVIAYTYGWGISDNTFEDGEYNKIKTIYTDFYFKNTDDNTREPSDSTTGNSWGLKDLMKEIQELKDRMDWHNIEVDNTTLKITI